jgi:hypothetical protein
MPVKPKQPIHIMPGLSMRYEDETVMFSWTDFTAEHIDTLFDNLFSIQRTWPTQVPFNLVLDISRNRQFELNSHFRNRMISLTRSNSQLVGQCAILIPIHDFVLRRYFSLFISADLKPAAPDMDYEFFFDELMARQWLKIK